MNQRLEIFTLGGLKIRRGGVPVTDFHSRKVEALLVYLACSHRPIPRDLLADLLWDHLPQERAMANLRVVLHSLRQQLDPYVTITHDEVGLDPQADVWLDVAAFEARLDAGQPEAALDLYHGDFLEGFFLRGAPRFEDWTAAEREHLYQRAVDELGQLVASSLATGQYQEGMPHARRLLALAPYLEEAHRQLMLLLAYSRRPRAALAQYQNCRQVLKEELGVAPAPQTTALYQQIRAGQLQLPSLPNRGSKQVPRKLQLPAFLTSLDDGPQEQPPLFVARERELAQLEGFLEAALRGQGRVVFVTGGPGRGKTALMKAFAQRAMAAHPQLLVASGACNAYAGVGDPYLPFREVLATITGDIESQWRAGTITRDHARRLWHALPVTIRALLDNGPHVVPALVPGEGLLSRCFAAVPSDTPWLRQLSERAMRWQIGSEDLKQSDLFQQVTHVLRQLALSHPLLFTLDDLQWADLASIGLLFHLGLRIESSRILIVGAYRPEELALGPRVRHPLEKTLSEFRRRFGDVWVDLAQVQESESQAFVNAFVDTEPNHLGEGFRRALFQHTGGHALFTIELLRTMQARGDVVQDEAGNWVEGPALDWKMLPPKVEGVIAERLARLDNELRSILDVASVEGEAFMAQVVARVQKLGERQALQALSHELEKRHRLVREQEALRAGGQQLSRYRFSHALFQQYLYHGLSEGERALLHGAVAAAMEALYAAAGRTQQVAVQLAHHYSEAGDDERALAHLTVAGDGALEGYANQEAESHYRAALELVHSDTQRAHLLSGLGRALDRQGRFQEAIESWRAGIELYQAVRDSDGVARLYAHSARAAGAAGDPPELLRLCQEGLAAVSGAPACPGVARLLHETARAHIQNALLEQSRSLCQQALTMAEQLGAFEVQVEALATLVLCQS